MPTNYSDLMPQLQNARIEEERRHHAANEKQVQEMLALQAEQRMRQREHYVTVFGQETCETLGFTYYHDNRHGFGPREVDYATFAIDFGGGSSLDHYLLMERPDQPGTWVLISVDPGNPVRRYVQYFSGSSQGLLLALGNNYEDQDGALLKGAA